MQVFFELIIGFYLFLLKFFTLKYSLKLKKGMIDTLHGLGQRLLGRGYSSPFIVFFSFSLTFFFLSFFLIPKIQFIYSLFY